VSAVAQLLAALFSNKKKKKKKKNSFTFITGGQSRTSLDVALGKNNDNDKENRILFRIISPHRFRTKEPNYMYKIKGASLSKPTFFFSCARQQSKKFNSGEKFETIRETFDNKCNPKNKFLEFDETK
jgi:hypothetical protein